MITPVIPLGGGGGRGAEFQMTGVLIHFSNSCKNDKRNSNLRKRKIKTEIQIPFLKCGENKKRHSNPFFNVTSRQKTKNRNAIPFYKAEEKRKMKMKFEFHFFKPSKNGWQGTRIDLLKPLLLSPSWPLSQ